MLLFITPVATGKQDVYIHFLKAIQHRLPSLSWSPLAAFKTITGSLLEGTMLGKKKACWRKPYSEALQKIHTFMISKIIQKSLKAISNKGGVCVCVISH